MPRHPEVDLLLCCARAVLDPVKYKRIHELLRSEVDWDGLISLAKAHGISPLLYHHFRTSFAPFVPLPVLNTLRDEFVKRAGYNLLLAQELLRVLSLLQGEGIPAVPFKGPVLAASVYGDLSIRPFWDLDILVRRENMARAKDLLQDAGYRGLSLPRKGIESASLGSEREYPLSREDGQVPLELHWSPTPRDFSLSLDWSSFWTRLEKTQFEGQEVMTFCPEDLVLLLCIHGTIHIWGRLSWICDLAELARRRRIDWRVVLERAADTGSERMVLLGFLLAAELLDTSLPEPLYARLKAHQGIYRTAQKIEKTLFRRTGTSLDPWSLFRFYMKMSFRIRDRVAFCLRLAFVPSFEDWHLSPLPLPSFFYSLIHPFRLAGKYGARYLKQIVPSGLKRTSERLRM